MKTCFKCNEAKPLYEFSVHKGMADGHLGKCKACAITYSKQHRKENPEYYRTFEAERAGNPERKLKMQDMVKAYRSMYPERRRAMNMLTRAVKCGSVVQQPCFVCGGIGVAHHSDYSRPLDVTWLCRVHHRQLHSEFEEHRKFNL